MRKRRAVIVLACSIRLEDVDVDLVGVVVIRVQVRSCFYEDGQDKLLVVSANGGV